MGVPVYEAFQFAHHLYKLNYFISPIFASIKGINLSLYIKINLLTFKQEKGDYMIYRIVAVAFTFLVLLYSNQTFPQWLQMSNWRTTNTANDINKYSETSLIIDTNAIKYFPLAVGNVYKYEYGASSGYHYYYKVRIIKDTIINSKRYFVSNSFPGYISGFLRCDSTSGNIYSRKNTEYCSYSPFEELIDSLLARKGDSTLVCTNFIPKHYCVDTGIVVLFGNQVKKKVFNRYTSAVTTSITYGMNFGIIYSTYSDFWGIAGESLVGCYINGALYGDTTMTHVEKTSSAIPRYFKLEQNYPNPFNPTTTIKFEIPASWLSSPNVSIGDLVVSLKVFDVLGREAATLVNEKLAPGTYIVDWNASQYPSGVYFYRLTAGILSDVKKMLIVK